MIAGPGSVASLIAGPGYVITGLAGAPPGIGGRSWMPGLRLPQRQLLPS